MLNSMIYIFSFIFLTTGITLYPKKEKTTMLLTEISMAVITTLCVGVIVAQIYTIVGIPVNIKTLSIVYFIFGLTLSAVIVRKRKIQKLHIDKWQVISVILFTVVFVAVECKTYTFELRPSFANFNDASAHFEMAMNVVRNESVERMTFAPLYNATIIEILSPRFPESHYYKAFILAEIMHYYFEIIFFYSLTLNMNNKKNTKYIATAITLVYWMGYPLLSFVVSNFVYWSWGVILFGYTICLVKNAIEDKATIIEYAGIMLGIVGVMQCYMLFTPFLLLSVAVLLSPRIYNQLRNNKKLCRVLVIVVLLLGIVAIFTINTYFGSVSGIFESLKIRGDTYLNLIGDLLLVIPVAIVFYMYLKENKGYSTYLIVFISNTLCLIPLLVMVKLGMMSEYYYSKLYYVVWLFTWLMVLDAFDKIKVEEAAVKYVKTYVVIVAVILASCFLRLDKLIPESLLSTDKNLPGTSLLTFNLDFLDTDYEQYKVSEDMRELYEYVEYIYVNNGYNVLLVNYVGGDEYYSKAFLYRAMTGQPSTNFSVERVEENEWKDAIEGDNSYDYFVIISDTGFYNNNKEYIRRYNIVFENSYGFIIEKP